MKVISPQTTPVGSRVLVYDEEYPSRNKRPRELTVLEWSEGGRCCLGHGEVRYWEDTHQLPYLVEVLQQKGSE